MKEPGHRLAPTLRPSGLPQCWRAAKVALLMPLLLGSLAGCPGGAGPELLGFDIEPGAVDASPGGSVRAEVGVACSAKDSFVLALSYSSGLFEEPMPNEVVVDCSGPAPATGPGRYTGKTVLTLRVLGTAVPGSEHWVKVSAAGGATQMRVRIVAAAPPVPAGWQALGGVVNVDENSFSAGPALVLDAAGRPLAAWVENQRVVVRRWDGSAWQTLAPLPPSVDAQDTPALALASDGAPVVAWTERRSSADESTRVQVRRWDGTAWQALGPSPVDRSDATTARSPALLSAGGQLVLAWAEETADSDSGGRVQVRRWDGSAWVDAVPAGTLPAPGQPDTPRLARLPDGRLAVAWRNLLSGTVQVALAGDSWLTIGSFGAANSVDLALLHAPAEGLLLVVPPSAPAPQFSVRRWTGSDWQPLGEPQGLVATGAGVSRVALATSGTEARPVLAWIQVRPGQPDFRVRQWDGSSWVPLGNPLPPLARTTPGTPWGLALAGAAIPVLATEVSQFVPGGGSDIAIRVREFR